LIGSGEAACLFIKAKAKREKRFFSHLFIMSLITSLNSYGGKQAVFKGLSRLNKKVNRLYNNQVNHCLSFG
jgi:hypothetical protein